MFSLHYKIGCLLLFKRYSFTLNKLECPKIPFWNGTYRNVLYSNTTLCSTRQVSIICILLSLFFDWILRESDRYSMLWLLHLLRRQLVFVKHIGCLNFCQYKPLYVTDTDSIYASFTWVLSRKYMVPIKIYNHQKWHHHLKSSGGCLSKTYKLKTVIWGWFAITALCAL